VTPKGLGEEDDVPFVVERADLEGRRCRLILTGELDLAAVPLLQHAVDRACREGKDQVSVDAANVNFIDSAGLMVLLNAREQLTEADGTFRVTAASQPVTRILEIAMLADELLDAPEVGHPDGAVPPLA
jgi:anti-anti-sigma factor